MFEICLKMGMRPPVSIHFIRSTDRLLNFNRYRSRFVQCSNAIYFFEALALDGLTLGLKFYRVQIGERSIELRKTSEHGKT